MDTMGGGTEEAKRGRRIGVAAVVVVEVVFFRGACRFLLSVLHVPEKPVPCHS